MITHDVTHDVRHYVTRDVTGGRNALRHAAIEEVPKSTYGTKPVTTAFDNASSKFGRRGHPRAFSPSSGCQTGRGLTKSRGDLLRSLSRSSVRCEVSRQTRTTKAPTAANEVIGT